MNSHPLYTRQRVEMILSEIQHPDRDECIRRRLNMLAGLRRLYGSHNLPVPAWLEALEQQLRNPLPPTPPT